MSEDGEMTLTRTAGKAFRDGARACLLLLALAVCGLFVGPSRALAAPYATTATIPVAVTYESASTPDVVAPSSVLTLTPANEAAQELGAQSIAVTPGRTEDFRGEGSGQFPVALPGFGTYEFRMTQTAEVSRGWTFDEAVWDVTLQVIRDEATDEPLVLTRIVRQGTDAPKFDEPSFHNVYAATWTSPGHKPVVKGHKELGVKVGGRVSSEKPELTAGAYRFQLKDESGAVVETATNGAGGIVEFAPLEHDRTGVYRYTLSEMTGDDANTEYDSHVVQVVVTVSDVDGELRASITYDGSAELPVFQNYLLKLGDPGLVKPASSVRPGGTTPTTGDPLGAGLAGLLAAACLALVIGVALRHREVGSTTDGI